MKRESNSKNQLGKTSSIRIKISQVKTSSLPNTAIQTMPKSTVVDLMRNLGSLMTKLEERSSKIRNQLPRVDFVKLEKIKLPESKVNRSKNLISKPTTSNRLSTEIMAPVLPKMLCMINFSNRHNSEK